MSIRNRLDRLERAAVPADQDGTPKVLIMYPNNGRCPETTRAIEASGKGYIQDGPLVVYDAERFPHGWPTIDGATVLLPGKDEQ